MSASTVQDSLILNGSNFNVPSTPVKTPQMPVLPNESPSLQGRVEDLEVEWNKIRAGDVQHFVDWMNTKPDLFKVEPVAIKDITISDTRDVPKQAIEEGFRATPNDDLLASQFVRAHEHELQPQGVFTKIKSTFWKALGYKS